MPNPAPPLPTCLFVDDESGVRNALKRALRSEAVCMRFADSGSTALEMLAEQPADVVVSDLHMPGMSGAQLLARVAETHPRSIRLVLSGGSGAHDILNAVNDGQIFRYILKPWDDRELKSIIRQALELSRLKQEKRQLVRRLRRHNQDLEKEVQQRTAQLFKVRRQAEIGKYASQIVHDLNNPLHAVTSVVDILRMDVASDRPLDRPRMTEWLAMAGKSVEDLTTIVSGILLHVRDQSQSPSVAVDLNALIRQELKFFALDRKFLKDVRQETCLAEDLPTFEGQPVQLKQVIDNLIRNAWDAMADALEKRLTIRTDARDGWIRMQVSDSGEGITPENLTRIFQPDFTTKPVGQGTGLGLASVKTMVEAYGGTIDVESSLGEGTTISVMLPIGDQEVPSSGFRVPS